MTTEVAVSLAEQGDDPEANKLEETIREYLKLEQEMKHHLTALGEIKNQLARNELNLDTELEDVAVDELQQVLAARVASLSGESASGAWCKTHPKWREFKQRVWAVHHPDEALPDDEHDEVIVQLGHDATAFVCPITRALLVHPVKNSLCGHAYSREAIQQYLKGSRGPKRCPVVGCAQNVTEAQLEVDLDLERRIERTKKQKRRDANTNVVDL